MFGARVFRQFAWWGKTFISWKVFIHLRYKNLCYDFIIRQRMWTLKVNNYFSEAVSLLLIVKLKCWFKILGTPSFLCGISLVEGCVSWLTCCFHILFFIFFTYQKVWVVMKLELRWEKRTIWHLCNIWSREMEEHITFTCNMPHFKVVLNFIYIYIKSYYSRISKR